MTKPFPPRVEWIQAWAILFRSQGTFSNYLGYVRVGCLIVKADVDVFQHPAVKRAKDSVGKAGRFVVRDKLWIRRHRIESIVRWAEKHPELMRFALLFLMCYVFLLRMPSEALPMIAGGDSEHADAQSVVFVDKDKQEIVLKLKRSRGAPWCDCAFVVFVHMQAQE